ncbi:granzyme C-like [Aphidius gifuensis]|nr:granzyme C-like [Aphidius gifuensis]
MILTVASCLVLETSPMVFPANIKVVITDGTSDIYDEYNNNMIYSVSYFLIHHEFKPQDSWRNDVALLKLEKSISYYTDRMKVYLPTSWVHRATAMSVIGWHNTKNLNIILMVVQSTKKCEEIFQSFNFRHDEQKCALAEYDHTGISEGDSGNPLFQGRTIVGLVSLYLPDKPNSVILTDVYTQVHWIKSTIIRLRILLRK